MSFSVLLTADAKHDLEDICDYIEGHEGPERTHRVLQRLEEAFTSLSENPERGNYPRELSAIGIRQFRQLMLKPYRIVYQVIEDRVYVMLVADGRRDMQTLLQRRLLEH
ncbi:MAG: type II toxin-antitoxin system RelE/ParE family toxin [Actinomycetota bacterium]